MSKLAIVYRYVLMNNNFNSSKASSSSIMTASEVEEIIDFPTKKSSTQQYGNLNVTRKSQKR